MSLWSIFLNHQGRLIHKWKHYFPAYEFHLSKLRNESFLLVEIGCGEGGSLQMWKQYFGPHVTIVGLDIRPECADFEEDQIHVRIGDQSDARFLQRVLDEFGRPKVIIDDGSHRMDDIQASFDFFYERMCDDGIYVVEDLHTCYWEEYGGNGQSQHNFIDFCKTMLDRLHAEHSRGRIASDPIASSTLSFHLYDSLAVFVRGNHGKKFAPILGGSRPHLTQS